MKRLNAEYLEKTIRERADNQMSEGKLGCGEIIVKQEGKTVLDYIFGTNGVHGQPIKSDTLFRVASMTKPITVTAFLQQWRLGRIDLEAPVSEYLPDYADMRIAHVEYGRLVDDGPAKTRLCVFHLMCHTNGLDVGPLADYLMKNHPRRTLADTVDYYAHQPLAFDPFSKVGYSKSAGFDAAARIVEMVSGEEYEAYLKRHVFAPLGMKDSCFRPTAEQETRIVKLHDRDADGNRIDSATVPGCAMKDVPYNACRAGGGILSTGAEYSRFAEMLLNDGENVLSPEAVAKMRTPHVPESIMPGTARWGLGVRVIVSEDYAEGLPIGTFGWSGAYGTHFWVDPVNRITAVYMRNSRYDSNGCGSFGAALERDVMSALEI